MPARARDSSTTGSGWNEAPGIVHHVSGSTPHRNELRFLLGRTQFTKGGVRTSFSALRIRMEQSRRGYKLSEPFAVLATS